MAFTTFSRIELGQGNGGPTGYFYPKDMAIVLNQINHNGLPAVALELHNAKVDGVDCQVLIAIADYTKTAEGQPAAANADHRLIMPDHLVALKCPPLNHPGGLPLP